VLEKGGSNWKEEKNAVKFLREGLAVKGKSATSILPHLKRKYEVGGGPFCDEGCPLLFERKSAKKGQF